MNTRIIDKQLNSNFQMFQILNQTNNSNVDNNVQWFNQDSVNVANFRD